MLTFQEIIQTLTTFWEKHGCIVHQGHSTEVGAGTFNPATFLRCLGPEPYNTVYVEPSMRPTDGRYGENPNRVQLFHQFQVIMKPSPENIQELYLDSLRALGLDLSKHDIRFVHDDWESPTLGAWGLGWEVWCDGMEVTQFTYFQAVASQTLHPISVELAYGIERLAMFIQNVENLFDLKWNETLTFGDISKQLEVEWSTYNFEHANTEMWHRHFDDFEREACDLIKAKLPIPAYDFALKASHAFNILDARGVISVTERTGYIARIRDLSRMVAAGYLKSREEKGFPLLLKQDKKEEKAPTLSSSSFDPTKTKDFLLEIGSEQLPATFVPVGMRGLERHFQKFFKEKGLSFSSIKTYGTPQRLTIHVEGLAEGTQAKSLEKKGPPVSSAFSEEGTPTPLGLGFLKSIGLENPSSLEDVLKEDALEVREIKGTSYLFYTKKEPGIAAIDLLAEALPKLILQLEFPKKMRWADKELPFARPIRWLLALLGEEVIPFSIEGIFSCNKSKGHAQLGNGLFPVKNPSSYLASLKEHFVLADPKERKENIAEQIKKEEDSLNLKALSFEKVLSKVLYLTEWPKIMVGSFDKDFLLVPQEVLISEMVEHQGYFPLADAKGELNSNFLITADNTPSDLILRGNQKVLSARLSDGAFLYKQDLKAPLETFNEKLKVMTFQKELGSMFDKMERISLHAKELNKLINLADEKTLLRSATLCKSDLAATLTQEFPELQGTIGKYYATVQNEPKEVALAIEEHWMPKSESGSLPKSPCGILLSLSDKVDNLLSYFSVGLKPTSSSDPYALKRQTFGLLKILIEEKYSLNLKELLTTCAKNLPGGTSPITEILSFVTNRAKSTLEDYGLKKDEIEAGLQGECIDPFLQFCKIKALNDFRKTEAFSSFHEVYKRVKGFLSAPSSYTVDEALLEHPAEKDLLKTLGTLETKLSKHLEKQEFSPAFLLLSELKEPLSTFLDKVKIQADDAKLKESRVALVNRVFCLFKQLLDFSKIQEL